MVRSGEARREGWRMKEVQDQVHSQMWVAGDQKTNGESRGESESESKRERARERESERESE